MPRRAALAGPTAAEFGAAGYESDVAPDFAMWYTNLSCQAMPAAHRWRMRHLVIRSSVRADNCGTARGVRQDRESPLYERGVPCPRRAWRTSGPEGDVRQRSLGPSSRPARRSWRAGSSQPGPAPIRRARGPLTVRHRKPYRVARCAAHCAAWLHMMQTMKAYKNAYWRLQTLQPDGVGSGLVRLTGQCAHQLLQSRVLPALARRSVSRRRITGSRPEKARPTSEKHAERQAGPHHRGGQRNRARHHAKVVQ